MHAPVSNATRRATYVDRTGKQPPTPQELRIDSTDAVKLAKFFVALGLTVEKQSTPEGRQYVLAKATNLQLSIFPSRTAKLPDDWNMTLIVDDAAAAAARAEASGGTIAGPLKDIPGGKKCVVASFEGHRVVVAQTAAAAKPKPAPVAPPEPEEEPDLLEMAMAAETADHNPPATFGAPAPSRAPAKGAPAGNRGRAHDPLVMARDPLALPPAAAAGTLTLAQAKLLKSVKTCCGVMLGAIVFSIVVALFVFVWNSQARDLPQAINGIAGIAAALVMLFAKTIPLGKNDNVVDTTPLIIAIVADVVGMLAGGITAMMPSLLLVTGMLYLLCAMASPILFIYFLTKTAEAVANTKLASFSRITMLFWLGFVGACLVAVVIGFATGGSDDLGMILGTLCGVTGLLSVLLFLALLISIANVPITLAALSKPNLPQGRR